MQSVAPKTNAVTITEAALRSFDNTPDPLSKQLLPAVVKHLHAFAREVDLTTDELNKLAEIFTQAGKISDASRHEFLLMNDIMGLTMVAGLALRRPD